jgi:hypothetical protein
VKKRKNQQKKKRITAEAQRRRGPERTKEETEETIEGDYWIKGLHG